MFSKLARWLSDKLGHSYSFATALLLVIVWLGLGHYYDYSNAWQLVINTGTTIVTFLMVFLLQNTQNHDTVALHLKLDELIRASKDTHNELMKVEDLSDEELKILCDKYENLSLTIRKKLKKGVEDKGSPDL